MKIKFFLSKQHLSFGEQNENFFLQRLLALLCLFGTQIKFSEFSVGFKLKK